jgi:D-methionine transport system ATP-binding protein
VPNAILTIKELSKFYPSNRSGSVGHHALKDVNFDIYPGDIYGLIGMSGAGKSTLMRCLLGLEKPTSGAVLFHEQAIAAMDPATLQKYRRQIGMVFQHFNLLPARTVAQNICYPMEIAGVSTTDQQNRVKELLELVGLEGKENYYPSSLSGGEKQRVGIARALANHPEILFCDEATSALDPNTIANILSLLQQLNQTLKLTIVVITHQFDVVKQICTRVGVLQKGELVEEGNVADLFSSPRHPGTRSLVSNQLPPLPSELIPPVSETHKLYRLSFRGEEAKQPVIARLLKQFDVDVNILQANIDSFQHSVFGVLVIELIGKQEEQAKALAFLKESHVNYEEVR